MTLFNELLPKLNEISNAFTKNFNDDLKAAFDCFDKFEAEFQNAGGKHYKEKNHGTTLQSIVEVEDENIKKNTDKIKDGGSSTESNAEKPRRSSKKRSKNEVDGIFSPEQDKRQKRNASLKAQSIISKQVKMTLAQKLRREGSTEDQSSHRRGKYDNKENTEPQPNIQNTEEKVFLSPNPMDKESLPLDVVIKQNVIDKDEIARPPPIAPLPKTRRAGHKEKSDAENSEEESSSRRHNSRTRTQTDTAVPPDPMDMESLPLNIVVKQEPVDKDEIAMPPPSAPIPKTRRAGRKEKSDAENSEEESLSRRPNSRTRKQTDTAVPPDPMDMESLPLNIVVKQEPVDKDEIAMPPPIAPIPKTRRAARKEKSDAESNEEEESSSRRQNSRTRRQIDTEVPSVAEKRSTRSSMRSQRQVLYAEGTADEPPAPRPKRTRAKKKVSDTVNMEAENETAPQPDNALASPAEKPRPKRTRRVQKAADKADEKTEDSPSPTQPTPEPIVSTNEEHVSQPETASPILQKEIRKIDEESKNKVKKDTVKSIIEDGAVASRDIALNETTVLSQNVVSDMNKTVVLPNGVFDHLPVTPKSLQPNMSEIVVLEVCNSEKMLLENEPNRIMDSTVVIYKDPKQSNWTDDISLMTDDNDSPLKHTPPKEVTPEIQPVSAVKKKVQQFEELASRVTRTKTRAMAKKEDEQADTQTPPDKIVKPVLSTETLNKMNNMIFNGKQMSSSATKPRCNLPPPKSMITLSASKLNNISKSRETVEDSLRKEKEDARKKKEALLEAKRELHKRKREEKMAAAAAVREAAERERRLAMEAVLKERMEKQAHVDLGKLERLKEAERKKHELARKVAETEERRRAEEQARQQRLADEQRRADAARRKQLEEAEAMKKEAAIMAKEIEKRQKEYNERQKLKQRMEEKAHTPRKMHMVMEPVHMTDGFQYLNSDEDEDPAERPLPGWCTSKVKRQFLHIQMKLSQLRIDKLFGVRVHSPDLLDIFPNIERCQLKRTSSAVWRTPPSRLPVLHE